MTASINKDKNIHIAPSLINQHVIPPPSLYVFTTQSLCKNVRELEYVDISYCVGLSDMAIRAISFYCRGLITLRMGGCSQVRPVSLLQRHHFAQ